MKKFFKKIIKNSPILLLMTKTILKKKLTFFSRFKWNSLAKRDEIKLDLGSGPRQGVNGWTTIDMNYWTTYTLNADICWDLRDGILLPDKSVNKIYTSHVLEHIPYNELIPFLIEIRRVLKDGGELSVCVPNFRFYIDAYMENRLFSEKNSWWQTALVETGSSMDQLNYMAYMLDEHKYMFDEENLINTLSKAGLINVRLRDFDSSIDSPIHRHESIYALCTR